MEFLDSITLAAAETPAPALSRGIAVLRTLALEPVLSLEVLASRLELPKASLYRLLETLQDAGCVRKTADKKYEALWVLKPVSDVHRSFEDCLISQMKRLCRQTGCTVEWYEFSTEGMKMMRQELPDAEVCVKARPGLVFAWGDEFNAAAQVGYAFASGAPVPRGSLGAYRANGVLVKMPLARVKREIRAVRENGFGRDHAFNTMGVRRWAVPVHREKKFSGILVVAESFRFQPSHDPDHDLQLLRETSNQMQNI